MGINQKKVSLVLSVPSLLVGIAFCSSVYLDHEKSRIEVGKQIEYLETGLCDGQTEQEIRDQNEKTGALSDCSFTIFHATAFPSDYPSKPRMIGSILGIGVISLAAPALLVFGLPYLLSGAVSWARRAWRWLNT